MVVFLIILYILISCIVGCALHVFFEVDDGFEVLAASVWPISIIIFIGYLIISYICNIFCKFFRRLKYEGFHYCKENIEPCCGQCKYIEYVNYHTEINRCDKCSGSRLASTSKSCSEFKKDPLWRFKIRYKWD